VLDSWVECQACFVAGELCRSREEDGQDIWRGWVRSASEYHQSYRCEGLDGHTV
jgi:hypothetical protein